MRKLLSITTNTLGGALIIIVVASILGAILGEKPPWFFIKICGLSNSFGMSGLNIEDIFDKEGSIQNIDSKDHYLDAHSRFYLKKPLHDWRIDTKNPGKLLNGISKASIPFFRFSANLLGQMVHNQQIYMDDIITTTFFHKDAIHEIEFTKESIMDGYPLEFNPFKDVEFVKRTILGSAIPFFQQDMDLFGNKEEITKFLDADIEEERQFIDLKQKELIKKFNHIIQEQWPEKHKLSDCISITTFKKSLLTRTKLYKTLVKDTTPSLFLILDFLALSNPELLITNTRHIDVDKENNAMYIDASITLENVFINGKYESASELTKIFLITINKDTIYVVSMQYLYRSGSSRSIQKELEKLFASFRVVKS